LVEELVTSSLSFFDTFAAQLFGVLFFFFNLLIRSKRDVAQTAGADLWIIIILLDIAIVIENGRFSPYLNSGVAEVSIPLFLFLAFFSFGLWFVSVDWLEKKIQTSFNHETGSYESFPFITWLIGWSLLVSAGVMHYYLIFLYGTN